MAYYPVEELRDIIDQFSRDKIKYVEIEEFPPDDDDPEHGPSLWVSGIVDAFDRIEDSVDSVQLPDEYQASNAY